MSAIARRTRVGLVPVRERHVTHIPGAALDERGDRGGALTHHQIAFPMPDLGPLSHDGRTSRIETMFRNRPRLCESRTLRGCLTERPERRCRPLAWAYDAKLVSVGIREDEPAMMPLIVLFELSGS